MQYTWVTTMLENQSSRSWLFIVLIAAQEASMRECASECLIKAIRKLITPELHRTAIFKLRKGGVAHDNDDNEDATKNSANSSWT
ncbi:hypothetical protein Poli38472_011796 [Pythium oligandrum]|uniref:Uncharacterized protein n=1 Tax=Pythium oligandrum TaxID=41045 RepID=A0A8K1C8L7_PYTOL|nr:hypothetical protein Poli38472_011796 [Pythium oligandrum]|eukprot:TMW58208.1 hypothetical protein Poli38472_011796 [Pythium oligandrum]